MAAISGITTYGRHETTVERKTYDEFYAIPADYVDAVRRAGGVPVLLPPGEPQWQAWLDVVDGIIIAGGADVSPKLYGGDVEHPNLTVMDPERDETELALAEHLIALNDMPTFCICRGMQVLNVAMGGTLHEHIPDVRNEDIHRNPGGGFWALQPVEIEPATFLADVMGDSKATTYSGHHQAIKDIAAGLTVVSRAEDEIIEAIEKPDHPWLVAVQWHPEKSAGEDASQQRFFDELVAAVNKG